MFRSKPLGIKNALVKVEDGISDLQGNGYRHTRKEQQEISD